MAINIRDGSRIRTEDKIRGEVKWKTGTRALTRGPHAYVCVFAFVCERETQRQNA